MTADADPSGGMPADFVTLAALVGGGPSLAAAIGLLRRKARQYCATQLPVRPATDSNGDSNAPSSCLAPPTPRNDCADGAVPTWNRATPEKWKVGGSTPP